MRLLVTGANGFLGSAVCSAALAGGHEVHGTVRAGADLSLLDAAVTQHVADMADPDTLAPAVEAAAPEAVVHCAAIVPVGRPDPVLSERVNVTGTAALVAACEAAGVRHIVHISSMSAQPDNRAVYGSTKRRSEEPVMAGSMAWTVLRPSLIYGPGDRSVFAKMVGVLRKAPVVPVLGSGKEPVRPVHVKDCAGAVMAVLAKPETTSGKRYCLGGKDALDVNAMLRTTAEALGKRAMLVHVPLVVARLAAHAMQPLMANPPFTLDNIEGVEKAAYCDIDDAVRDFGYDPLPYAEGLKTCEL